MRSNIILISWVFKLILSLFYYNELVLYFIFFDIVVFIAAYLLDKTSFFYFSYIIFQITSIALYLSYNIESSSKFSYGGDDSQLFGYIKNNTEELIVNYPLFLYVNSFVRDISIFIFGDIEFKFLLYINNIVASLTLFNYFLISKKYKLKNFYIIFLFTPFFYFSSLFLRDVYIYFFVSLYFLLIASNYSKLFKITLFIILMTCIFFLRPESALILPLFEFFRFLYSKITSLKYRTLILLILFSLSFNITILADSLLSITSFGFRDVELMKDIYLGDDSIGAIGRVLMDNSSFGYYLFNLFRPIPPYYLSTPNFENFIQIFGNLFWYIIIITCFLNPKKILKSNSYLLSIVSVLLLYVALVSFIGGTSRHFYAIIPFFILHIYNIPKLFNRDNNLIILSFLVLLISSYTIFK